MEDINLDTPDIMDAKEAAKIWGKNNGYVRTYYKQNPDKFPSGSIRKFGSTCVVTTKAKESITGEKDPRKNK